MFRTIKSTVLSALSFSIIFLSCTKEYSIEKAAGGAGSTGGTAVFSLEGSPGVCASAFLSGSYTAGTAVTAANTVLVSANVTTIGTYTITTSTANGIKFTGAGSFTTTGLQFIELTASGTATAAGTFNYTSGTTGCSFPVTFTTSGGGGSGSGTAVFTFNGAPGYCTTATVSGVYTAGTALGAGNTVVIAVNVTTAGSYTISTGAANGISFSGSGVLALGAQTITLTGSGTPVAAGTNNFTPGTNGCAFPVTTVAGSGGSNNFLIATITGTASTQFNTGLIGTSSPFTTGIPGSVSVNGTASSTGTEGLLVAFLKNNADVTAATYKNVTVTNSSGVVVQYADNAGGMWMSSFLTNNTFTAIITSLTATTVSGTFSGTLYKDGTGPETKTVTNGSFSVTF